MTLLRKSVPAVYRRYLNSTSGARAFSDHSTPAARQDDSIRGKVLAIRREDQSVWERRAPLAPHHVRKLVKDGARVLVQPSNRRAYPMQAYINAGAQIKEDIGEASVIMGVKQVPIDALIPNKTYCFFSHTIKAQEANMPLLDAILEKNIRLLDYERMCDERGQRVVAFGKYAGVAGMINIMHGMGLRLLALGHHTPFMHIGPAHNYRNSEMARQAVRDAGYEIALGMLPRSLGALTFVFTGSGNVSQGAQEIIQELPHEYVSPDMLQKVAEHGAQNKVYCCEVSRPDYLERRDGGGYNAEEYEEHPERYISTFATKIGPNVSCLVNGIYWDPNSPKLLTLPDAKRLLQPVNQPWLPQTEGSPRLPHRMIAICDISADPGGSLEMMTECTTIDSPFCLYDADQHKDKNSFRGPGVLVCSIDNMPTQLPREATDFFGNLLFPYVYNILQSNADRPFEQQPFNPVNKGAVIASNGKLTPNFEYIDELRRGSRSRHKASMAHAAADKRVLVIGSGYVSEPLVEYLSRDPKTHIHLASAVQNELDALSTKYDNTVGTLLNVTERPDHLSGLVEDADVVVSLLPYSLHPVVARACIQHKTDLVTASYCTPEMRALEGAAKDAGITVVNEVGLDPGIDHLLAMECFDEVHHGGGKVKSFVSYCGGLPAPECSDNALRYKFSWSPIGVLRNTTQGASYLKDGKMVEIPAGQLLHSCQRMDFLPGFALEGFANRDSTIYGKLYGIQEAQTILRGTLRYCGYSEAVLGLQETGLLSDDSHPAVHPGGPDITWYELLCTLLGQEGSVFYDNLRLLLLQRAGSEQRVQAMEKLGLLSDAPVHKSGSLLRALSDHLAERLRFGAGERDLVVLRHEIDIEWPDKRLERRGINLVTYGHPDGFSAMARTVGYPCAIATQMVLNGEIQGKGMVLPLTPEIFRPLLKRLQHEGITATQKSTSL
ncbi:Alpha-aminoadipic semialdehyde synthase, mitochondrial [Amphibalanus amphitrite]|uniref:Alpha-aminoadipic semialdehyde synthase, mitochondrial n=1 Tax=Amphibalanus amphitrite TaxID=1232801 RepID=A0A6A4VC04_AMPAM|nr:alpha-aminoadipic semialdehyde synthase, mitochondrial-like isoform X1 [Amphibalanus amphitrite]XP_043233521.1 alpha-aminoadipic semialdehyde synthase, mitochondrial-like isoform X1 [Amphibalanus amphitrite]XP_043233522.1 alpha-aminoadipic semialdehyde synthase, mitochondrial-like isoform X1 [Amphibalanus amphitrite]KAF0287862.1 Alpha-aminoadipic semialdehyde synthase, mitochondrial [Amphibalanus amphitrite]